MANIINGKEIAYNIRQKLKNDVHELRKQGIIPKLAVVMVGNNSASKIYVRNKSKVCEEIGIDYEEYVLDDNITIDKLINLINSLNNKKEIHGILLQSPIPKNLDINEIFKVIEPKKDVDGLNPTNVGKLALGQECFIPCTPQGIIKMIQQTGIDIEGKNAVIIGRSNIVGKPLLQCLLEKNATVTICHSKTKNIKEITRNADILIAALGKAKFVTEDMVKEGAVVIDVGINRTEDGQILGDVDFDNVSKKVSHISPVPGGVGPMTIAMLMENVIKAAKIQR